MKSASPDSTFMSHNTDTRLNPILNAHNSARFGISVVVNNPLRTVLHFTLYFYVRFPRMRVNNTLFQLFLGVAPLTTLFGSVLFLS